MKQRRFWQCAFYSQPCPLIPARIDLGLSAAGKNHETEPFQGTITLKKRQVNIPYEGKFPAMYLSNLASSLWKQMIHNLNAPDWASRHLADRAESASLSPLEIGPDAVGSSLETAMRRMGLLARQTELPPPTSK